MKFKIGDQVRVTAGKDKGKQGKILKVIPDKNRVLVSGANIYAKHLKPMAGRAGQIIRAEKPLATAKIVILNDKGEPDRIGYQLAKDGQKIRIFKRTGAAVPDKSEKDKKK